MKTIVPSLVLLVATFGAADSPAAQELARGDNAAVLALLDAADRELSAKRPDQASLLLERALRIEPSNPAAWHYLGLVRLEQGQYAQAEAMAAKSMALAPQPREPERAAAVARSSDWRRSSDPYAEQVERQRAARQGRIESRSAPEIEQRRERAKVTGGLEI